MGVNVQHDFIGGGAPAPAGHRNRMIVFNRPSVAEQKQQLCDVLERLATKPPAAVVSGSIQTTRQWRAASKSALTLIKGARTSVMQLEMAIKQMRSFE